MVDVDGEVVVEVVVLMGGVDEVVLGVVVVVVAVVVDVDVGTKVFVVGVVVEVVVDDFAEQEQEVGMTMVKTNISPSARQ